MNWTASHEAVSSYVIILYHLVAYHEPHEQVDHLNLNQLPTSNLWFNSCRFPYSWHGAFIKYMGKESSCTGARFTSDSRVLQVNSDSEIGKTHSARVRERGSYWPNSRGPFFWGATLAEGVVHGGVPWWGAMPWWDAIAGVWCHGGVPLQDAIMWGAIRGCHGGMLLLKRQEWVYAIWGLCYWKNSFFKCGLRTRNCYYFTQRFSYNMSSRPFSISLAIQCSCHVHDSIQKTNGKCI